MKYNRNMIDFDEIPEAMAKYLKYYGLHFNNKLCKYAVSLMTVGKNQEKLVPYTKEDVDNLLNNNNIKLEHNKLSDYVYVANMCKADFLKSSVPDEQRLVIYIKNVIDDVDGYDGIVFNRWYADMCYKNIPIEWEEML